MIAVQINLGTRKPDKTGEGPYTREWACRTMALVNRSDITGKVTLWVPRQMDLKQVEPYLDYFLPRTERGVKLSGTRTRIRSGCGMKNRNS